MTGLRRAALLAMLVALAVAPAATAVATATTPATETQLGISSYDGTITTAPGPNSSTTGADTGQPGAIARPWPVSGIGTIPPVLAGDASARTELAVVDTTVEDHKTLARAAREAGMDVVNVSSAAEMEAALANRSNLAAVHVLSHGTVGTVQIGNDTLQHGTLDQYSGLTGALDSSLAAGGDVLLYGCLVAENGAGIDFVENLTVAAEADIAASDDVSGNAAQGGDWDLEVSRGAVQTAPLGGQTLHAFDTTLASFTETYDSVSLGSGQTSFSTANLDYSVDNGGDFITSNHLSTAPELNVKDTDSGAPDAETETITISRSDNSPFVVDNMVVDAVHSNTRTVTGYDGTTQIGSETLSGTPTEADVFNSDADWVVTRLEITSSDYNEFLIDNLEGDDAPATFNDDSDQDRVHDSGLTVTEDASNVDITRLLDVSDDDSGDTLTWSVASAPSNGNLGGFSATATSDGGSVTPTGLTYTPDADSTASDSFDITIDDGSGTETLSVNVDVQDAPEVSSITRNDVNPTNQNSVTYDVTFSESVSDVDTSDFTTTVTSGSPSPSISSVDDAGDAGGSTYTVDVSVTNSGAGTFRLDLSDDDTIDNGNSVPLGGVGTSGGAGDGSFTSGETYTIDNTAPTLVGATKIGDTTIDVDLSESDTGFDVSTIEQGDFSLDSGTIASIDKSTISDGDTGTQMVTINLGSAVDDDTVTVSLQSDGIDDLAGNTLDSGSADAPNMDGVAPTLDGASKVDDTTIDVDISEAGSGIDKASIDSSDFTLDTGSISSVDTSSITDGDTGTQTVTINLGSAVDDDTVTVSLQSDGIDDLAGNTLDSGSVDAPNMDGVAPTLDDASKVGDTTIDVDLSDSGAGFDISTIEQGDFSLDSGTISSIDTSSITDGDTGTQTVTINLDSAVDDDTVTVSLGSDGIDDMNGNTRTTGSADEPNMDGVAPTLDGASKVDDTTIDVDISEAGSGIDKASIDSSDFTLDTGSISSVDTSSVTDGNTGTQTVTINLASAVDADTVTVDLQSDGIDDKNGNTRTSGSASASGMDGVEPTVSSITRSSPANQNTNAASVDLSVTFSESVTSIGTDDFSLSGSASGTLDSVDTASGTSVTVTATSVSGDGSLGLDLASGGDITDSAGNALDSSEPGTDETYTIDNTAPSLTDDSGSTDEDTSATIIADLLNNDNDATALTVTKVEGNAANVGSATTGSNNGQFTIDSAGQVDFDPNGAFESLASTASDTTQVTVTVQDDVGNTNTQTVTATVTGVNDAPTASGSSDTTDEDSTVTVASASGVVDAGASDPDTGDSLSVDQVDGAGANVGSAVTGSSSGQFTINSDGSYDFDPNGAFDDLAVGEIRTTNVGYRVADGNGGTDTATLTVTVNGVNDAPTALSLGSTSVAQSGGSNAVVGSFSTTDADTSDTHTYSLVSGSGDGDNSKFNINSGDLRADDASTLAEGTYNIRVETADGNGGTYEDTFTISVTDDVAPTLSSSTPADDSTGHNPVDDLTLTFSEDIQFGSGNIVLNDVDGATTEETFDVTSDTGGGDGTVSISSDMLTISPTSDLGSSTEYAVQIDSSAIDDTASSLNSYAGISNDNDLDFTTVDTGPSFTSGSSTTVTVDEDGSVDLTSALEVSDVSTSDTLTWTVTSAPSNGGLSGVDSQSESISGTNTPHTLSTSTTYTPNADFDGSDSFTVQVGDNFPDTTTSITVTVNIQDAPEVSFIDRSSPSTPTNADSVDFIVTFDESVSNVDASDFTLTTTNSATTANGDSDISVAGSGTSRTVTVANVEGDGTLGIDLDDDDTITNGNSVPLGGDSLSGAADGSYTSGQTFTVDNTAPTLSDDSGSTDEDSSSTTIVADLLGNDNDAHGLTVTQVEGSSGNVGSATAGGNSGQFTIDSAGQVDFDPNGAFESLGGSESDTTQVSVTVEDDTGNTNTQTVEATVNGVNDAPTMSSAARSLTTIDEDATDNSGTTVSSILGSAGSTGDAENANLGVGVTGVDDTDGHWEYSTDGGSTWQDVSSASPAAGSALLLAEDDHIRFVPTAEFNGNAGGSVTLRAWDQTSGSAGDTSVDTTTNGDTTAYASTTVSASITVQSLNDAPSISIGSDQTVDGDTSQQSVSNFATGFSPGPSNEGGQSIRDFTVTETSDPGSVLSSVDVANSGELTYTANDGVEGTATVDVQVVDDGGTSNGGTDTSPASSFDITVDTQAPTVDSASVSDTTLTVTMDEQLSTAAANTPAGGDFTVTAGDETIAVTDVSISDSIMTLTLDESPSSGDSVSLAYTQGTNIPGDTSTNQLADFSEQSVVIETEYTGGGGDGGPYTGSDDPNVVNDDDGDDETTDDSEEDTSNGDDSSESLDISVEDEADDGTAEDDTDADETDEDGTDGDQETDDTGSDGPDTLAVTIENADSGSTATIDQSTTGRSSVGSTENVSVDSVSMTFAQGRDRARLNITTYEHDVLQSTVDSEQIHEAARDFEDRTGTVTAGYVEVDHDFASDDLSDISFQYSVRKSYLSELGVSAGDVQLYHRADGEEWTPVETAPLGENETHHRFESSAASFSVFAIGTGAEPLDVRVSEEPGEVTVSDQASLAAVVENRGAVDREYDLTLRFDDAVVTSDSGTVDGGDSKSVELSFAPETAGEYELAANGETVTTVTVQEDEGSVEETETTDESDDDKAGSGGGLPLVPIGVLLVVIIVVAIAVVGYRRQSGDDSDRLR